MKHSRKIIIAVFALAIIFFLIPMCKSDQKVEVQKVTYKNKINDTLDKIEQKLAELRAERYTTTVVERREEIAKYIRELENLENNLYRKLGEIDYVPDDQWSEPKASIEQLLSEYQAVIRAIDSSLSSPAS